MLKRCSRHSIRCPEFIDYCAIPNVPGVSFEGRCRCTIRLPSHTSYLKASWLQQIRLLVLPLIYGESGINFICPCHHTACEIEGLTESILPQKACTYLGIVSPSAHNVYFRGRVFDILATFFDASSCQECLQNTSIAFNKNLG
jgi:hypothetical protein